MRQLTSLDAQFLALENNRTHGHVGSLAVYDPATAPGGALTVGRVRAMLRERLHLLTPFRWRLVEVPFSLDHPFWVEEAEIDLDYHVREIALPAPGNLRQLAEQSARIFERRLDRSRPLWEMYLIHGVEDGTKVALLTKVHHAALDGLSGAEILVTLMDLVPEGREIPLPEPGGVRDSVPSRLELLARGLTATPRHSAKALRSLPTTLPNLDLVPTLRSVPGINVLSGAARRVAELVPGKGDDLVVERLLAPKTSLNRRISAHRRCAFTTVSLGDVKRIKNHFGVTVNDVVVAITAGALREWLLVHDELPTDPLLAMIPVSVRLPEEFGTFGNRVSMMTVPIPTNEHEPAQRVHASHEAMDHAKARHNTTPRMLLQEANEGIPPLMLARTAQTLLNVAAAGTLHPPLNVVISNVPGSPVPLYFCGARLEANYPLSVITDGMGLNLTILSYQDRIDFGIVGDREEVPDVWFLAEEVQHAFHELLDLVPREAAPKKKRAKAPRKPRATRAA
jgi:diacylglycerol O-acyltransferase